MPSILRLTQNAESENQYRVEVAFEGDGLPRQIATARFEFKLTAQDQEDLRWYLEDFLQYPLDPAPKIAARIEQRMVEIGTTLFKDIFQSGDDARDLWAILRDRLDDTRVEIITEVREAAAIPWELIRDTKTDTALSLRAHAFVRAHSQAAQRPQLPRTDTGPIRILLVICRPGGGDDVPFRSVASRLIKGLGESARDLFQLDVLRPPTFERLAKVLREAKDGGRPYHVVHFDGHGVYADVSPDNLSALVSNLSRLLLSGPRTGAHGYLLFENPTEEKNAQLVDGPTLGELLVETHVPVLAECLPLRSRRPADRAGRQRVRRRPARQSASLWIACARSYGRGSGGRGRDALQRLRSHGHAVRRRALRFSHAGAYAGRCCDHRAEATCCSTNA